MLREWRNTVSFDFKIVLRERGKPAAQSLKLSPSWFGIPASVENYVAVADQSL